MTLEDEEGRSYNANYLVARDGLSGGWKNFAERHSLKVDDTLVFRLVSSEKFKVSCFSNFHMSFLCDIFLLNARQKQCPFIPLVISLLAIAIVFRCI